MEEERELPVGWQRCLLGDVVDYGKTQKAEPAAISDDSWVLELEDIEKDSSRLLSRLSFAERQSKSTKNAFNKGDVLYGKLRPYLNKVLLADGPGYCSTEIIPLPSGEVMAPGYLFHWLKSPEFLGYTEEVSHGINMPRLGTEAGRKAPFVLAPLNEQHRIAAKLDTTLASVDACRQRLDGVAAILKRFRQAVLSAATSGELTREWREERGGTYQRCCPRVMPGLSILTQCTAICCSWATRKSMAQHLGLRLVVVAPVPNRGCSRCRPKEGVIGQPRGPELLH